MTLDIQYLKIYYRGYTLKWSCAIGRSRTFMQKMTIPHLGLKKRPKENVNKLRAWFLMQQKTVSLICYLSLH